MPEKEKPASPPAAAALPAPSPPFTPQEVVTLNEYQQSGAMHPFTCGGNRTDANHGDGEGILVATIRGWICPFCDYTQNWAHDFIKNGSWKRPLAEESPAPATSPRSLEEK